jgi:hypothetical protein
MKPETICNEANVAALFTAKDESFANRPLLYGIRFFKD